MIVIHTYLGYLVLLLFIIATLVSFRAFGSGTPSAVPPMLRRAATGLLDLQILVGIVTYILHFRSGWFILHPIIMVVAVASIHMLTTARRSARVQSVGYLIGTVLMLIGVTVR